ncbi:MAG: helix-turn-helix domain-containing protein [Sphingomicrobium sp.]
MDETEADDVVTVGQRLREAREAKGLSIEDIAASTRIPTRHLSSLETSEWDKLPAATYSVGFAKNYAAAVGLDRAEIAEALRLEMGGTRPVTIYPEVYEAADPARTMPKGLVFGALALLALVVLGLTWMSNSSMAGDESAPVVENAVAPEPDVATAAPAPAPAVAGPVVLTANEAVWISVKDGGAILKQGELGPGQSYEVPANAVAPVLTTGKPEALRISVGTADAPAVGPAGETVSGVSLRGPDLLRGPAAAAPVAPTPTPPAARTQRPAQAPAPPPAATPDTATSSSGNSAAPATLE